MLEKLEAIEEKYRSLTASLSDPTLGSEPQRFKIIAKEGDAVKKGDTVLIMEAMKMENNVLAEKEGIVKKIMVSEGDSVLQGDLLIEIE